MLWAYVFLPDAIFGSNDDSIALGDVGVTEIGATDVVYRLLAPFDVVGHRYGERGGMSRGEIHLSVPGYQSDEAPRGVGPVQIEIDGVITPQFTSPAPEGRLEAHGPVEATLRLDGREVRLSGLGQWHEEARVRPEGGAPFTYMTMRGRALTFVARSALGRSRGWAVLDGGGLLQMRSFEIEDTPLPRRAFHFTLEDGTEVTGVAEVQHDYFVGPRAGRRRPGAIAVASTAHGPVSGLINYTTNPGPPRGQRRIGGRVLAEEGAPR